MGVTELLSGSLSGIVLYVAADSVCLWEEVSSEGGSRSLLCCCLELELSESDCSHTNQLPYTYENIKISKWNSED